MLLSYTIDYNSVLTFDPHNKQAKTELGKLQQVTKIVHIHVHCTVCTYKIGVKESICTVTLFIMCYMYIYLQRLKAWEAKQ